MPGESQMTPTSAPDPTVATNESLARGDAAERDYVIGQLDVIRERLRGIDRATELLNETVNRVPTDLDVAIGRVTDLIEEKFKTVDTQFLERDERGSLLKKASDDALAAALQAAKELVGVQAQAASDAATKAETSFTKQIDQIGVQIVSGQNALDARITELKERIDRGEGNSQGVHEQRTEQRLSTGQAIAIFGGVVAFLALIVVVIALILSRQPAPAAPTAAVQGARVAVIVAHLSAG
jgi:hypothetical protein